MSSTSDFTSEEVNVVNSTLFERFKKPINVEIADSEMQDEGLWVRGFIHVERQSQKGILIGKGGTKIKTIRVEAEKELSSLFPYRIWLDLRVKVSPKWRGRDDLLKKLVR